MKKYLTILSMAAGLATIVGVTWQLASTDAKQASLSNSVSGSDNITVGSVTVDGVGNTQINGNPIIYQQRTEPLQAKPKIPSYKYKIINTEEFFAFAEELPTWEIFRENSAEIVYLDISLPKQGFNISVMPKELTDAIYKAMRNGSIEHGMSPAGLTYDYMSKDRNVNAYLSFIDVSKSSINGENAVSVCLDRFSDLDSAYLKNTESQFGVCNTNTWIYFEGEEDDIQMFAVNMSDDPIGLRIKGYYKLRSYRSYSAFGNREYVLESVSRSEAWAELALQ
ncbi:hypothetical protein ACMZOO_00815 [Catenovulum sp. SX2]|uniref:hypothetical protein n=1 Tax=Catenovulum sp. SX2 TaxID=3398614 RepID=UPI003F836B37